MRPFLLLRSPVLWMLYSFVALAQGREPNERSIFLSDHPGIVAPNVYVVGRIVTVLRLEQPCDPARTSLLGWEGRFAPPVCAGTWVLLEPLQNLTPEDRFMLRVTLVDGTELPFTVTSREGLIGDRRGDQQVNVFRDPAAPKAVLASLYDALEREQRLKEEVEHYKKEDSVDHGLARLLVKGATAQTPFLKVQTRLFREENIEVTARVFSGKKKAAVLFEIKNQDPTYNWTLMQARLANALTGELLSFALSSDQATIAPGQSGNIAVVVDKSAFSSRGALAPLVLELFRKEGGLQQVALLLEPRLLRE